MLLSNLEFGSFLTYCPRGDTQEIRRSKNITYSLKHDRILEGPPRITTTSYLANSLANQIKKTSLNNLLGPGVTLVPAPKSSKYLQGSLWVPERLAIAMVEVGLGDEVKTILERNQAVPKASFSAPKDRPIAIQHYQTISAHRLLEPLQRIVIVDDIITRGATMLGAASRLAEAYPEAVIQGFAMIRTISNPDDFIEIEGPCMGNIRLSGDQTFREP